MHRGESDARYRRAERRDLRASDAHRTTVARASLVCARAERAASN